MDIVAKQKKRIVFFIACIGIALLLRTVWLLWNTELPDFSVYYYATSVFLRGENPYIAPLYTQFNYPTPTAVVLSFITIFPYNVAIKLWLLGAVVSYIGAILAIQKLYKLPNSVMICVFTLSVFAFPFKFTLGMGQINTFVLFLICLFFYYQRQKKEINAGIILALAILLKVFPLVFIIPVILAKQWRILTVTVVTVLTMVLFSFLYNYDATIYFFQNILKELWSTSGGSTYYNQSITGLFARLGISHAITIVMRYYILIIAGYVLYKNKKSILYINNFLLTTTLLLNNFTWQHHLLFSILPFVYLYAVKKLKWIYVLIVFSYMLIAYNIARPETYNTSFDIVWLSHGFIGLSILWLVLFLLGSIYRKKILT